MREKLLGYSLNLAHTVGGPKARGFERILGITIEDVDHLEAEIRTGILVTPISSVRDGASSGGSCVVEAPVRGVGGKERRAIVVRTVWELTDATAPPRLITLPIPGPKLEER